LLSGGLIMCPFSLPSTTAYGELLFPLRVNERPLATPSGFVLNVRNRDGQQAAYSVEKLDVCEADRTLIAY
jgi:hypothetical protein